MGPCRYCARPGAFGLDTRLARIRALAGPIWACADHRAGLPETGKAGQEMDQLQEFLECEAEDLAKAAAAMARHWQSAGLGDAVRAIGREHGLQGAKVLLAAYFQLRAMRQNAERHGVRDVVPY